MNDREPYLSVVLATRNDDHGGNPLWRLQAFVDTFDAQCRRTGLDAEVIIVEWNPPVGRPRLIDVLPLPRDPACAYRFVEVPPELHATLSHAEALPLFQMIAKNVGIRRARGAFVLATNIDIIFSNELVEFMARRELAPGFLYRLDRHDVESRLPLDQPVEARMEYCRSHQLRVNRRAGTYPVHPDGRLRAEPNDIVDGHDVTLQDGWHVLEKNVYGPFRWAAPCATIVLDPYGVTSAASVLEIDLEPNPFSRGERFDLEVADGAGVVLGRLHVASPMVHRLPLSSVPRTISLRYIALAPDAAPLLPLLESRRTLAYLVRSIALRHVVDVPSQTPSSVEIFPEFRRKSGDLELLTGGRDYPLDRWRTAEARTVVQVREDGTEVAIAGPPGGYVAKYGPLSAPSSGEYRFVLDCSGDFRTLALGALSGSCQAWLPTSSVDAVAGDRRTVVLTFTVEAGQAFWLMITAPPSGDDRVFRFGIRRLTGTGPDGQAAVLMAPGSPLDVLPGTLERAPGRLGEFWSSLFERVGQHAGPLRHAVEEARHAMVVASPEVQALSDTISALRLNYRWLEGKSLELQTRLAHCEELQAVRNVYERFRRRTPPDLHLNGCGDFQLMARQDWMELRGYPEVQAFSMNLDGLFATIAFVAGIEERVLESPCRIFHLEHESGSGWTPEGEDKLRRRVDAGGIPWVDARMVSELAAYMTSLGRPMILNDSSWGFGQHDLPEQAVRDYQSSEIG